MANKLRKFKEKCKTIIIRSKTEFFTIDFDLSWFVKNVSYGFNHDELSFIGGDLIECINKARASINEIYWKEFLKFFWDWIHPGKVDPNLLKDIFF